MSDMADVIVSHIEEAGGDYDLSYSASIRRLADDMAAALSAAGFGLVADAGAKALEDAAALAEMGEGGGIDSGECDDWSAWLRARAASMRPTDAHE